MQVSICAMMKKILICLLILPALLQARVKPTGFSFITNYPKEIYRGSTQNWSVAQDSRGILYFGNNQGLLSFDGTRWRVYPMPNNSIVRSVYIDEQDIIYTGAFNEFGFFVPDGKGELIYHSLMEKIPVEYRDFSDVWNIMAYKGGILFHSFSHIFYVKDQEVTVLGNDRNLHFSFEVSGDYYVMDYSAGILKMVDFDLELIPHSEIFRDITVSRILPWDDQTLLVVTREEGLFLLDNTGVRSFRTEVSDHLNEHQVFSALRYNDDYYIFGTVQDGLVIMDRRGRLIQHLNRSRGLQNNTVLSMNTDANENLWLGLDNGIDFIMLNSPFSYLAHESEIGAAYVVAEKQEKLYIGTNQGLYKAGWPMPQQFANGDEYTQVIPGSQGQVWMLSNLNDVLLVGHDKGVFVMEDGVLRTLSTYPGGWNFVEIPGNEDYILGGTYAGIIAYRKVEREEKTDYKLHAMLEGFTESSKQMVFDSHGYLWVGHGYRGIYRLEIGKGLDSITDIRHYTRFSGLPSNHLLNIVKLGQEVLVCSQEGIFSYDRRNDLFSKDEELSALFSNHTVHNLYEDINGNIWFFADDMVGLLKSNFDGTYSKTSVPFMPLRGKLIPSYENVYLIDRKNILFPTEEGVLHFDPTFPKDYADPFPAHIRSVNLRGDSLLYGGYRSGSNLVVPEVRHKSNALQFTFSAIFFEFPAHNQYSYKLEGFDEEWSEWSQGSEKEYTNLHEGEYRFMVKARNVYGMESQAEPFDFIILPPWYRSRIAWISYSFLFVLVVILIVMYVLRRMERERQEMKEKQQAAMVEQERQHAEESLRAEQEIIKLRNEKLEIENLRNRSELENKSKELASVAMQMTYKNELLTRVRQKLRKVSGKMLHRESKQQVEGLIKTLEKDIMNQEDWEKFEVHFDQVHEDFLKKLRTTFPQLTPKDLRLCAYLRMNLSSKEIAPLLNISIRGVEISRYRLRKKLYLDRDINLTDFMMNL